MQNFVFENNETEILGEFRRKKAVIASFEGDEKIIHAQSLYSVPQNFSHHNTAYINSLSSFRSYISGKVAENLTPKEYEIYENQNPDFSINTATVPILLEKIIPTLPGSVDYISIPMSEKSMEFLREYYWKIGKILKEKSLISEIGNFRDDSVYYRLKK